MPKGNWGRQANTKASLQLSNDCWKLTFHSDFLKCLVNNYYHHSAASAIQHCLNSLAAVPSLWVSMCGKCQVWSRTQECSAFIHSLPWSPQPLPLSPLSTLSISASSPLSGRSMACVLLGADIWVGKHQRERLQMNTNSCIYPQGFTEYKHHQE